MRERELVVNYGGGWVFPPDDDDDDALMSLPHYAGLGHSQVLNQLPDDDDILPLPPGLLDEPPRREHRGGIVVNGETLPVPPKLSDLLANEAREKHGCHCSKKQAKRPQRTEDQLFRLPPMI